MKEFSNKIEIYLLEEITSIVGTTITLISSGAKIDVNTTNDVLPSDQPAEKSGMTYYKQSLNVISEKLSDEILIKLLDIKVVVKLFINDLEEILLGSVQFPARCKATPSLNADTLKFTLENANPLLS